MNNNTVSFSKNGGEIKDTYLNIVNNAVDGLKWLVITNDASNELFVEETGESLKDFVDFLGEDATKVKYGICKTIPPGSDVEKLLFIGFCSDYLSIKPKMAFMKNLQIVRDDLFNNYHVMMEIRDESDLNYESISKRLGDAAGARYSIQTGNSKGSLLHSGSSGKLPQRTVPKASPKASPKPVVPTSTSSSVSSLAASFSAEKESPVKKTTPVVKASPPVAPKPVQKPKDFSPPAETPVSAPKLASKKEASNDEDDWSEPPLEEKEIGHKGSHTVSTWTPIGKVDLKKLIAEEKAKVDPRLIKETFKPGFVAKKKIEIAAEEEDEEKPIEEDQEEEIAAEETEEEKEEEEEEKQSEEIDQEEAEEEEKDVADSKVEDKEEEKSESNRQADIEAYLSKMSKKSGSSNFNLKKVDSTSKPETKPSTLPARPTANKVSSFTPEIIKPKPVSAKKEIANQQEEVKVSKQNYKKFGIPLPGLHVEEPEATEEEDANASDSSWSDEEKEEKKPALAPRPIPTLPPRSSTSVTPEPVEEKIAEKEPVKEKSFTPEPVKQKAVEAESIKEKSVEKEPVEEIKRAVPPPPPTRSPAPKAQEDKAKALFDYEADESNEISFKQGEVISHIEKKFDDWWYGANEAGETGVFPSNYVELE